MVMGAYNIIRYKLSSTKLSFLDGLDTHHFLDSCVGIHQVKTVYCMLVIWDKVTSMRIIM